MQRWFTSIMVEPSPFQTVAIGPPGVMLLGLMTLSCVKPMSEKRAKTTKDR